jgi:hypothetical protein
MKCSKNETLDGSFDTDGYSISFKVLRYYKRESTKQRKEKQRPKYTGEFPNNSIGIDVGVDELLCAYHKYYDNQEEKWKEKYHHLKAHDYFQETKMNLHHRRNERDKSRCIRNIEQELKHKSPKRGGENSVLEYARVIKDNWDDLWKDKKRIIYAQRRFETYRKKQSVIDNFFHKLKNYGDGKPTIYYGDGAFSSTMKGKRPVPTVKLYEICRKHHKTYDTDEYRTTKICSTCHGELEYVKGLIKKDSEGKQGLKNIRGLQWCRNQVCCKIPFKSRDPDAAKCIYECGTKEQLNGERPSVFKRETTK